MEVGLHTRKEDINVNRTGETLILVISPHVSTFSPTKKETGKSTAECDMCQTGDGQPGRDTKIGLEE